ncbi:signal peptidase II [Brachybacterium huguangmaarense]
MTSNPTSSANAGRDASGVRRVRPSLSRAAAVLVAVVIALVIAVLDQWSKHWAETALELHEPREAIGELLRFHLLYNSGAAWGMGASITPVVTIVQMLICLGALVVVVRTVRSAAWAAALGLVIGGALGNIHDRLLRPPGPFRGEVVDFLRLPNWPVFNVADMAVVAGAILIVLLTLLGIAMNPGADASAGASADESAEQRA